MFSVKSEVLDRPKTHTVYFMCNIGFGSGRGGGWLLRSRDEPIRVGCGGARLG